MCVITYYCKVVVGPGVHLCTLLEVWVLGVGMSTLGTQTALYTEDRGFQVPMTLDHNLLGRLYSLGVWPTISFLSGNKSHLLKQNPTEVIIDAT